MRGGYGRVLQTFGDKLRATGVEIRLQSRVENIQKHPDNKIYVDGAAFDKVILTAPANVAAKICPQLSGDERTKLDAISYQGIVCASVLLKHSLADFYVTNITDEAPFTAVIEMSALVYKSEFGDGALVYLPKYLSPDDEMFEKTDDEMKTSLDGLFIVNSAQITTGTLNVNETVQLAENFLAAEFNEVSEKRN